MPKVPRSATPTLPSGKAPVGSLNERQARFVEEYLIDFTGTQAAIRAGYSPRTANEQASVLLTKPNIRKAVTAGQMKLTERTSVTKAWIVQEAVETYRQARLLKLSGAARGALELLAKLHGHIIERRDLRLIKDWADLNDDEVAALAGASPDERDGTRH